MMPEVNSGPMIDIHCSHYHQGYHPSGFDAYDGAIYYHGSPVYTGIDPNIPSPPAASHNISPYDSSGTSSYIQPCSHPSPTYTHEPSVAFVAMSAMPSAPGVVNCTTVTHVSLPNVPTTVMQPVAPGIPDKGTDSAEIHN
jgi:hypothetical protein